MAVTGSIHAPLPHQTGVCSSDKSVDTMALPQKVTFATINVCGLRSKQKQVQLRRLLFSHHLDFVAVQETKIESEVDTERALRPYLSVFDVIVSHAVGLSAGCLLFLRKSLPYSSVAYNVDAEGRLIQCDFMLYGLPWRLINVYAFNDAPRRTNFFESLATLLDPDRNILLMGDFNCVCSPCDRTGFSRSDKSAEVLSLIVQNAGLVDIGALNRLPSYTHAQGSTHTRIDRIYVSAPLISRDLSCKTEPISFSDHCIVVGQIGHNTRSYFRPQWALWKLNSSIVSDQEFTVRVHVALRRCLSADMPLFASWEFFKQEVRTVAIEIGSVRGFYRRLEQKMLLKNLQNLYEFECEAPGCYTDEIANAKCALQRYDTLRYRGARVRSRNTRTLHSEEPTRQALLDEYRNAKSKFIPDLYSQGSLVTNTSEIMTEFEAYYTALFSDSYEKQNEDLVTQFLSFVTPLSDEECESISGPITLKEIELAVDQLPMSKTPGPDGMSGEFYKTFKSLLCPVLLDIFTQSLNLGTLPQSFTRSHTVLIPKYSDREKLRHVDGYRPITLCNVDYKIFAKILSNRLQFAMSILIGAHQTCGLKGRSIQTNIHIARTVLEHSSHSYDQLAILQVDLAKAFDRVRHSFVFSLLDHANIGSTIFKGIKLCYSDCSTRLIVKELPPNT